MESEQNPILRKAIFEVNTNIRLPELFEDGAMEFYRNEVGYNVVIDCKNTPILSNNFSEFYDRKNYFEARLAFHSIVHHKKYTIKSYKAIVLGKYGETPIEFGATYVSDNILEDPELKDYKGEIFLSKPKASQNAMQISKQIEKIFKDDVTLRFAINRYNAALNDSDNQFFYLYDIKESIRQYFESKGENYEASLGLKSKFNSDFGKIANGLPLFQSRHRGSHVHKQMIAETREILNLRNMSRELILKFISHLFEEKKFQFKIR